MVYNHKTEKYEKFSQTRFRYEVGVDGELREAFSQLLPAISYAKRLAKAEKREVRVYDRLARRGCPQLRVYDAEGILDRTERKPRY